MGKQSKKKKLKALKYEVMTLRTLIDDVVSFIGFEPGQGHESITLTELEPYNEFQKQLRATEEKYSTKAS
jgi:hypothetical protein